MDLSLEKYKKILWENQISPSLHRLRILEYLDTHRNHPTVDDIFNALIDEIPTLSRTTVYNTMKKFMKHNLIDELHVFSNESRFDLSYTPHAHYKCEECGKIIDLSDTFLPDGLERIEGNKVRKHYTYFLGVCQDCEKEGKKK